MVGRECTCGGSERKNKRSKSANHRVVCLDRRKEGGLKECEALKERTGEREKDGAEWDGEEGGRRRGESMFYNNAQGERLPVGRLPLPLRLLN